MTMPDVVKVLRCRYLTPTRHSQSLTDALLAFCAGRSLGAVLRSPS